MKKFIVLAVFLAMAAEWGLAQTPAPHRKFVLDVFGGYAQSELKGRASYHRSWSHLELANGTDHTAISADVKKGMSFGINLTYYIKRNWGVQLSAGYFGSDLPTKASSTFNWQWKDGRSSSKSQEWTSTGEFSTLPISLNFVGRVFAGKFEFFGTVGPTMFNNSFNLKSSIGYGDSAVRTTTYSVIIWPYIIYYTVTSQYVDVFTVPADIANQSWTGFGANLGGGITFNLSRGFSLVAEARYYYCPKKELNFAVSSGSYNGALDNLKSYALSATTMDALVTSGAMSKMSVNPSFIRAAFGLRISFGKN